jgi:hypothetical protein
MPNFTDNAGRTWAIDLNVTNLRRVRDLIPDPTHALDEKGRRPGVDLLTLAEPDAPLARRLNADPILLADCLFALAKPQADAAGVSDAQFGEALAGDAIAAAVDALLRALADFFPHGRREILRRLHTIETEYQHRKTELILRELDNPETTEEVERALDHYDRTTPANGPTPGSTAAGSLPALSE